MSTTGQKVLAAIRAQEPDTYDDHRTRTLLLPTDRYVIDFCDTLRKTWKQYDTDQDAHYFGVWVQPETWETLTYAEGDWTLVSCDSIEAFRAKLADMERFYGAPPPAFTVIDQAGNVTKCYDERPTA